MKISTLFWSSAILSFCLSLFSIVNADCVELINSQNFEDFSGLTMFLNIMFLLWLLFNTVSNERTLSNKQLEIGYYTFFLNVFVMFYALGIQLEKYD